MKIELQNRCELFIRNKMTLEKAAGLEFSTIYPVAANVLTSRNVTADLERLKACKKLLKEKTGIFSSFRGNGTLPVVCMLALDNDPEAKMDRASAMYKRLKQEFSSSEYLPLAAMILADQVSENEADALIGRGHEIYRLMKKDHPFLTGSEDGVFAVLLAFSEKSNEQLVSDMELVYEELKEDGFKGNSSLAISRIFAMAGGDLREKCAKLKRVLELLKEGGRKYGKNYELGALAGIMNLPVQAETVVADMLEADAFLSEQKGYGLFGFDKPTRLMHAALITADLYSGGEDSSSELSALTGTIAVVASIQIAIIVAVAAGTSSTSSSM